MIATLSSTSLVPSQAPPQGLATPREQPAESALPPVLDAIELASLVGVQSINKMEMTARYTNNIALHLLLSDAPAVMSMVANAGVLPPTFGPVLDAFNTINVATGVVAIAADLRETRGTLLNPNATRLDKTMDVTHLVAGDVLSTVASLTPLVTPLSNPAAMAFFVGGQVVGIGMDIAKTVYDFRRKGQQSARAA